ncbi:cytosine permease [Acidocella sp.]|uniref:purine-cytosine permease family protein n=1 Tax=Acidocella sp. TaxID=50710 RepID=UPI002613537F|nr:cytosine permease [Acidocella sp.]
MTAEITPELYGIIEEKGIEEVSLKETHGSPKAVFGLWMAANVEFATLTTGALATCLTGLSFFQAMRSILLANLIGAVILGYFSTFGVDYGRPQMIQGANWFGPLGNRLPSLLNFFGGFSWFAVNTTAGAYALNLVLHTGLIPAALGMSVVQIAIAVVGYDLIHAAEKYLMFVLVLAFLGLTFIAVRHLGLSAPANPQTIAQMGGTSGAFMLSTAIMVGYQVGWIPYSSDYTRYLRTNNDAAGVKKTVFTYAFWGALISTVWIEGLGALIGSSIPFFSKPSDLLTVWMPEWFKLPFLVAVILGTISANIINIYSATMSILAVGIKLKQHVASISTGIIGAVISAIVINSFVESYTNFLLVLGYWTMPWIAVTLLCHKTDRVSRLPVSAAFVAWIVAVAGSVPFWDQQLYTGVFAASHPQFGDSTFIVSFVIGAVMYMLLTKPAPARLAAAE